MLGKHTL